MALNGDILAEAVQEEFGNGEQPTEFLKAFCRALVLHIQTYGQVGLPLIVVGTAPPGGGPVVAQTVPSPPGAIK